MIFNDETFCASCDSISYVYATFSFYLVFSFIFCLFYVSCSSNSSFYACPSLFSFFSSQKMLMTGINFHHNVLTCHQLPNMKMAFHPQLITLVPANTSIGSLLVECFSNLWHFNKNFFQKDHDSDCMML